MRYPKAAKRRVARGFNVLGLAVDADPAAVFHALVAEFRSNEELFSLAFDRTADEPLVLERTVHIGRVEEIASQFERAMDRVDGLVVICRPVELGHPHAAEPDGGHLRAGLAERASLHEIPSVPLGIAAREGRDHEALAVCLLGRRITRLPRANTTAAPRTIH